MHARLGQYQPTRLATESNWYRELVVVVVPVVVVVVEVELEVVVVVVVVALYCPTGLPGFST